MSIAFLTQYGFVADPFEFTNADQEPDLERYFVPPPYFASVLGDPANPKSTVVLAPRGGGKSAQRRMVEVQADGSGDVLVVPYSDFTFTTRAGVVSREVHLTEVSRSMLLAILTHLALNESNPKELLGYERDFLLGAAHTLLGKLDQSQLSIAVRSLRTPGEKVLDAAKKAKRPVKALFAAVLSQAARIKIDPDDLSIERAATPRENRVDETFAGLVQVARFLGFKSVYVLVDKVDERPFTNQDARAAFNLIEELVLDLPLLEQDGIAFKFFLWDQVDEYLTSRGFRRDRITKHELRWSRADLQRALSERLAAYSKNRIKSFQQLCSPDVEVNMDVLLATLAQGSPRDMIRMASRIISETTKENEAPASVTTGPIWDGMRTFADERADELFPSVKELRRVGKPTFSMSELASDILRVQDNAARRRVQLWQETGLVAKVGEVQKSKGGRPQYVYGVTDVRLLIAILPTDAVPEILGNYVLICPHCDQMLLDDRTEMICTNCSRTIGLSTAKTLLQYCFT